MKEGVNMIKSDLYGALARGYCSEKNSGKTVDPDLIEAMAEEILLLYTKNQGSLEGDYQNNISLIERTAQLIAHRACCGSEHDPANGKLHGYCVVCGVPWPCEYAKPKK
jgi:hypothetical protein